MKLIGNLLGARLVGAGALIMALSLAFPTLMVPGSMVARADSVDKTAEGLATRRLRIVSTTANAGSQVVVSVELESEGDEVAASFTLNFDQTILSSPVVALGSGVPAGSTLSLNTNQIASGRIGILVDSTNPFPLSPPNRQMITVTFNVAANAVSGVTPITFVTSPTPLSVSNPNGVLLQTIYEVGTVTINGSGPTFVTIGGRVTTPSGLNLRNAVVSLIDSNNVRRTATTSSFGLYSFDNVETGQTYTITVASKRYRFAAQIVPVTEARSDINFVGLE